MKRAYDWLKDARLARQFEDMMAGYEIYDGELESLAGGFWNVQLDNMQMAGLEPEEYEACEAFITTDTMAEAALKMNYSTVWYSKILRKAWSKIDKMLGETTKYCNFRDVS